MLSKFVSGTNELESGGEENFFGMVENVDLKGAIAPLSTVAIMPSPIFLWRFKVSLFVYSYFKICVVCIKNKTVFIHKIPGKLH